MPFNAMIVPPLSGGGVDVSTSALPVVVHTTVVVTSLIIVVTSVVTGPTEHTTKYLLLSPGLWSGLENCFEKPRFLGLKKLKIFTSPNFRFFGFFYFCPIVLQIILNFTF